MVDDPTTLFLRSSPGSRAGSLPLVAGLLALDFANTASGRGGPEHREHLRGVGDLLAWAHHAEVLGTAALAETAALLRRQGRTAADALLAAALRLRELLYITGKALAAGDKPAPDLLAQLVAAHGANLAAARLDASGGVFRLVWEPRQDVTGALIGPLTASAMTLLTESEVRRVKQCAGNHCGWLFFDATKNGRRRWCEMSVCGNRAKQRAYRLRRSDGRA